MYYNQSKFILAMQQIAQSPENFLFNRYMTNGFFHHYRMDESTSMFRGVRSVFNCFISFFNEVFLENRNYRIAADGTPRSASVP